jgi:hypothetical protein
MKVSTIEKLFSVTANPFLLLEPVVCQSTVVLFTLAMMMWVVQIAASFPPGSLTITSSTRHTSMMMTAASFNASFVSSRFYQNFYASCTNSSRWVRVQARMLHIFLLMN